MMHPILHILERVHTYLRAAPDKELRSVAVSAGMSERALRHARSDRWEPKPTNLAKLDEVLWPTHSPTMGTTVPVGKPPNGKAEAGVVHAQRENGVP